MSGIPETPTLDREVLALARIARMLERSCSDSSTHLSLPQYRLLAFVVRGEERASNLAEQLTLTRPTVSAAIDTLVDRGLLERTSVDTDRRAIRLTITPAGTALVHATQDAMRARLDTVVARTDDPDLVRTALAQLMAALDALPRRSHTPPPART